MKFKKGTAIYHIMAYLKGKSWTNRGAIEKANYTNNWGFNGSTISRKCRKLAENNYLQRKENAKGQVCYKIEKLPTKFKETSEMSQRELRSIVQ